MEASYEGGQGPEGAVEPYMEWNMQWNSDKRSAFYFRVEQCSVQSAGNQSASCNNPKYINLQERNSCDDPTRHSASSNSEKRVLER